MFPLLPPDEQSSTCYFVRTGSPCNSAEGAEIFRAPPGAGKTFMPSLLQRFGPQCFEEFEPEDSAGADRCRDEDVDGMLCRHLEEARGNRDIEGDGQQAECSGDDPPERLVGRAQGMDDAVCPGPVGQDERHVGEDQCRECQCARVGLGQTVYVEAQAKDDQDGDEDAEALKKTRENQSSAECRLRWVTWWPVHDVGFLRFAFEDDGTRRVDDEFQEHDVHRLQDEGPAQQHRNQAQTRDGDVDSENVAHSFADVVEDAAPHAHCCDDTVEVVLEQDDGGGLAGDVGSSFAHGDADMGILQGWRVVDAVAGHGDDLTVCLERLDQAELLFRDHASKHADVADLIADLFFGHGFKLWPGDDAVGVLQTDFSRDGLCRARVVARDHDDAHPSTAALGDGGGYGRVDGIGETDQTDEFEIEVVLVVRQIVVVTRGAGNSKDAQAVVRHVQDLLHDQLLLCLWHVTQVKNRLWRTLGGYAATAGVHLPRVRQGQHMARKRILALQLPVFVKVFSPLESTLPHVQDGTFHGVEGVGFTGQDRVLDQFMEPFRKDSGQPCRGDVNVLASGRQLTDGHLVHRKGASLVDAQDGRRPQCLDGRR